MMYDDEYADHEDDEMVLTRTLDEHEEEEEEYECSDDEEEDEDGLANLLMDKSFWKQHAVAIVIALVGSIIGHSYTSSSSSSMSMPYPSPSSYLMQVPTRNLESDSTSSSSHMTTTTPTLSFVHPHLESYRRTDGFMFCPRRFMGKEGKDDDNKASSLKRFDLHIPAHMVPTLSSHFQANHHPPNNGNDDDNDDQYACLMESYETVMNQGSARPVLHGSALAYISPPVDSFYPKSLSNDENNDEVSPFPFLSSSSSPKQKNNEAVTLTFTGFAAKFVNMSPQSLNLYWDGKEGPRLVGRIDPYEAIGTATIPGQGFYVAPLYDSTHALARWVLTADDALIHYTVTEHSQKDTSSSLQRLSEDHQKLYDMHQFNILFARDYLIETGRVWLAFAPRPPPRFPFWDADNFDQQHVISTRETHFHTLPPSQLMRKLSSNMEHNEDNDDQKDLFLEDYRSPGSMELTLQVVSCAPRVFQMDHFLSPVEVQHLLQMAETADMKKSTLHPGGGKAADGAHRDDATRSSTNAWVHREESPIVNALYRRAADVFQIPEKLMRRRGTEERAVESSIAEALQLVHYGPGQEYAPHHDFHYPSVRNPHQPSRFATLLLYLNDVTEGGETTFPRAQTTEFHDGIRITPKAGTAVLFYNMLPDGNMDDLSQHGSLPVVHGEKWLANLWVWDPLID